MKYNIPADKLIAKIVELRKELPDSIEHLNDEERGFARGQQYELTAIEEEVLCIQQEQPEVDIQEVNIEEITKYSKIKELPDGFEKEWLRYYHTNSEYNSEKFHHLSSIEREYIIARHFYNLVENARKEE